MLLAWRAGAISWAGSGVLLAAALLLHAGVNVLNDYYDFTLGYDTPAAAGDSGLLTGGVVRPAYMRRWGHAYLAAGALLGVLLGVWRHPGLLALGGAGLAGAFFYSHRRGYKYRGVGEPCVFVLMGPLLFAAAWLAAAAGVAAGASVRLPGDRHPADQQPA